MATGIGRPSGYSEEIADLICAGLSNGNHLSAVLKAEGMPNPATVYRWITGNPSFREKYALAREIQAEVLVGEIIEIADDSTGDITEEDHGDGVVTQRVNQENINRSRLRVDARKWYASKVLPKKYGDRLELSGDAANPLTIAVRYQDQVQSAEPKQIDGPIIDV